MGDVVSVIVSGLFGGGVGLLGTLVGRVFGWLEEREKIKRLSIQNEHELKLQQMQFDARSAEREYEYAITELSTESDMRTSSYQQDAAIGSTYKWVNAVRALMRPLLTVMAISALMYVIILLNQLGDYTGLREAMAQLNFLAMTAYVWWFGSRDTSKK
jgi:hypothetical protein